MQDNLVLLIEDDPDDEALVLAALHGHEGIEVRPLSDGVQALDYLFRSGAFAHERTELPRLVLLDLKLPKLNGFEVLQRIRAHRRTSLLPVVIMTSSKEEQDRIRGYQTGANSYVQKPVDLDRFREVVRHMGLYWIGINEPAPLV